MSRPNSITDEELSIQLDLLIVHDHCASCYKVLCSHNDGCKMVLCTNKCGASLHACKIYEHEEVCDNKAVPCINRIYGCPIILKRKHISTHLYKCPASVVLCPVKWKRNYLHKHDVTKQHNMVMIEDLEGPELDIAFAQRDFCCMHISNEEASSQGWPQIYTAESVMKGLDMQMIDNVAKRCRKVYKSDKLYWPYFLQMIKTSSNSFTHENTFQESVVGVSLEVNPASMYERGGNIVSCGKPFRRDEYAHHYANVHVDIHDAMEGRNYEVRCPLAYRGCRFSAAVRKPQNCTVIFNRDFQCVNISHDVSQIGILCTESDGKGTLSSELDEHDHSATASIMDMPDEILHLILVLCDSISLKALSAVNQRFRHLVAELLTKRGIVQLVWKREYDTWKISEEKWCFSTHFQPIRKWLHKERSGLAKHMNTCSYYDRATERYKMEVCRVLVGMFGGDADKVPMKDNDVEYPLD